MTCVKVIPLLLNNYPQASLVYRSRTVDEISRKVESFINNQRFRIYSQLIPLKFGEKTFAPFSYEQISGYLLINRRCHDIKGKEKQLIRMLAATYNNLPDIS
jgi:hypothetical protein